jgi:NADH dehydrogenase [ubiquinone] 1 alpha subcomplex assembly factor 7
MSILADALKRRIATDGPMTVGTFMAACLTHPTHGYYVTRDPLGRGGDFVTAPEISQIFGELIGAWCVVAWEAMGKPARFTLVELGPGRGTLMADALRAAKVRPEFLAAMTLHLVEASPVLRREQERALVAYNPAWHGDLGEVPPGPTILIANEFFDALPIEQFVRRGGTWRRRMVGLDANGALILTEASEPAPVGHDHDDARDGVVLEMSPAGQAAAFEIGGRLRDHSGMALIFDFGREGALGESLQALRGHAAAPILDHPGDADLAAHVDFRALAAAATAAGVSAYGPLPQGAFLRALGIETRGDALARAEPARAAEIALAVSRLVGARAMGHLFQALSIASPNLGVPAGFESAPFVAGASTPFDDMEDDA